MGTQPLPLGETEAATSGGGVGGAALFLGAGFSKWAADLPLAPELFDFSIRPYGIREDKRLAVVRSLKERWDEDSPGGMPEQFIAYALQLPRRKREAVLWYAARRLSGPFVWSRPTGGGRHSYSIGESIVLQVRRMREARDLLLRFCSPATSGIVTTNYDLVVEHALGPRVINYGVLGQRLVGSRRYPASQWGRPVVLSGMIPLAKIHGSISWDQDNCYLDGRRALSGRALIIAPTPEKSPPAELRHTWVLAKRILESAHRLIVFGFAFNPYDEAVLELLRSSGASLRSVAIVDIQPQMERAQQLWPNAVITSCQPPPEGPGALHAWRLPDDARLK